MDFSFTILSDEAMQHTMRHLEAAERGETAPVVKLYNTPWLEIGNLVQRVVDIPRAWMV